MKSLLHQTKTMKIELFMKIADSDGNGLLSFEEIYHLAYLSIEKNFMFCKKDEKDEFIEDLATHMSEIIFSIFQLSLDEEIPL